MSARDLGHQHEELLDKTEARLKSGQLRLLSGQQNKNKQEAPIGRSRVSPSDKKPQKEDEKEEFKIGQRETASKLKTKDASGPVAGKYTKMKQQQQKIKQKVVRQEEAELKQAQQLAASLRQASNDGKLELIRLLLRCGANLNAQDEEFGNSPLHLAAWNGFSETIQVLCKHRANTALKNKAQFTPLHLACQQGHNQSARLLLLAGARTDSQNNYGDTPLHTAARYGHAGVARILLSAKCNQNQVNKNNDTPLHIAAAMGRRKLTKIFMQNGCEPAIKNKQDETAMDIALRKDLIEIQELIANPPASSQERARLERRRLRRESPEQRSANQLVNSNNHNYTHRQDCCLLEDGELARAQNCCCSARRRQPHNHHHHHHHSKRHHHHSKHHSLHSPRGHLHESTSRLRLSSDEEGQPHYSGPRGQGTGPSKARPAAETEPKLIYGGLANETKTNFSSSNNYNKYSSDMALNQLSFPAHGSRPLRGKTLASGLASQDLRELVESRRARLLALGSTNNFRETSLDARASSVCALSAPQPQPRQESVTATGGCPPPDALLGARMEQPSSGPGNKAKQQQQQLMGLSTTTLTANTRPKRSSPNGSMRSRRSTKLTVKKSRLATPKVSLTQLRNLVRKRAAAASSSSQQERRSAGSLQKATSPAKSGQAEPQQQQQMNSGGRRQERQIKQQQEVSPNEVQHLVVMRAPNGTKLLQTRPLASLDDDTQLYAIPKKNSADLKAKLRQQQQVPAGEQQNSGAAKGCDAGPALTASDEGSPIASSWDECLDLVVSSTSLEVSERKRDKTTNNKFEAEDISSPGYTSVPATTTNQQQQQRHQVANEGTSDACLCNVSGQKDDSSQRSQMQQPKEINSNSNNNRDDPPKEIKVDHNGTATSHEASDEDHCSKQVRDPITATGYHKQEHEAALIQPKSALSSASAALIKAQKSLASAAAAKVQQRDRMARMLRYHAEAYDCATTQSVVLSLSKQPRNGLLTVRTDGEPTMKSGAYWLADCRLASSRLQIAEAPIQLLTGKTGSSNDERLFGDANSVGMNDTSPSNNGTESDNSIQNSSSAVSSATTVSAKGQASSVGLAAPMQTTLGTKPEQKSSPLGGILSRILLHTGNKLNNSRQQHQQPLPSQTKTTLSTTTTTTTAASTNQKSFNGSISSNSSPISSSSPSVQSNNRSPLTVITETSAPNSSDQSRVENGGNDDAILSMNRAKPLDQLGSRSRRPIVLTRSSELRNDETGYGTQENRPNFEGHQLNGAETAGHLNGLPRVSSCTNIDNYGAPQQPKLKVMNGQGEVTRDSLENQLRLQANLCNYHALTRNQLMMHNDTSNTNKYSAYLPYALGRYSIHEHCDPASRLYGPTRQQQAYVQPEMFPSMQSNNFSTTATNGVYHPHPHHQPVYTNDDESIYVPASYVKQRAATVSNGSNGGISAGSQQRTILNINNNLNNSNSHDHKKSIILANGDHPAFDHAARPFGQIMEEPAVGCYGLDNARQRLQPMRPKSSLSSILINHHPVSVTPVTHNLEQHQHQNPSAHHQQVAYGFSRETQVAESMNGSNVITIQNGRTTFPSNASNGEPASRDTVKTAATKQQDNDCHDAHDQQTSSPGITRRLDQFAMDQNLIYAPGSRLALAGNTTTTSHQYNNEQNTVSKSDPEPCD